jgi:predicted aspartyl protease
LAAVVVAAGAAAAEATVWRYTDADGAVHIVADERAIPPASVGSARPVPLTAITAATPAPPAVFRLNAPVEVPFALSHGKPVVETLFDGRVTRPALIDTGSQVTTITTKLALALGVDLTSARIGRFATPSGSIAAPMVTVGRIGWGGGASAERVTAAVVDYPGKEAYSALIGMNALAGFVFEIDPRRRALRFLTVAPVR